MIFWLSTINSAHPKFMEFDISVIQNCFLIGAFRILEQGDFSRHPQKQPETFYDGLQYLALVSKNVRIFSLLFEKSSF